MFFIKKNKFLINIFFIFFIFFFIKSSFAMQAFRSDLYYQECNRLESYGFPQVYLPRPVQPADQLSLEEISYIFNRKYNVTDINIKNFLKKFGYQIPEQAKLPNLAFIASGGSYRAMLCFLGFMIAAQQTELLNTALYIATLSGSTWSMLNMLARNMLPIDLCPILKERVSNDLFDISTMNIMSIVKKLYEKWQSRTDFKDHCSADVWGALVTDRLMSDIGPDIAQNTTFASIRSILDNSKNYAWPFPLFSATIAPHEKRVNNFDYEWIEFSPYTVLSDFLGGRIDMQEFSSPFYSGLCQSLLPEENLATFVGLFGSAYSFSLGDLLKQIAEHIGDEDLWREFKKIIDEYHLFEERFLPALFNNYTYGMQYVSFGYLEKIILQDGGYDFNLPFPIALKTQRNTDIIIACDASSDVGGPDYKEMDYAARYFREKNKPFPDITRPKKISDNMTIFNKRVDPAVPVPTVIYFANPNNEFSTLKFQYSEDEFNQIVGGMATEVNNNIRAIAQIIYEKIIETNSRISEKLDSNCCCIS
ncbi:MAG: hypothetical protein WC436_04460 [Candidatus Babeliales bacterium]